ncbi:UxaA family hydrolase [Hyphomicrobium sp. CS1BSMeth3]|uniref:UxaA family hydrolase n=1 Tax=Hyphomicrobium sp. CS1BSMeth3 TaxID=1892844 RepID=UPI000931A7ED|nr:UxaA family hydrolase [Hyphomicrobium sp. CS1BSMeth3]
MSELSTFRGYRRPDGRVGIRNHVIVLPVDDISNRAAEGVAASVAGTLALPHAYGRLQFGADLDLLFRTLIGTGRNPNVAATVVIGIEPQWTERVVKGIAASGKPVAGFSISGLGDLDVVALASKCAQQFVQDASEYERTECSLSELVVSAKCGESDTTTGLGSNPAVGWVFDRLDELKATLIFGETAELTGGETIVAARCVNADVRERFLEAHAAYDREIIRYKSNDLIESNPTAGNIRGGITTIEEKAMGALTKIGRKARIVGVVDTAEAPAGPGLWFMDSSGAGAEMLTACAAAGATVHLFSTGQGNVVGNPILPVIKITANPLTARTMASHIDVDVSGILQRSITLDQAGEAILGTMIRTCAGRLTAAEALGHREFVMTRLFRTA